MLGRRSHTHHHQAAPIDTEALTALIIKRTKDFELSWMVAGWTRYVFEEAGLRFYIGMRVRKLKWEIEVTGLGIDGQARIDLAFTQAQAGRIAQEAAMQAQDPASAKIARHRARERADQYLEDQVAALGAAAQAQRDAGEAGASGSAAGADRQLLDEQAAAAALDAFMAQGQAAAR